jgi:hypothetical protein
MSAAGRFTWRAVGLRICADSTSVFVAGVGVDFDQTLDVFPKRMSAPNVSMQIFADNIEYSGREHAIHHAGKNCSNNACDDHII